MSRLLTGIAAIAAIAAALVALVLLVQRSVLFPAPRLADASGIGAVEVVRLTQRAGPVDALFLPATASATSDTTTSRSPLLIFLHGNAELVDHWTREFDEPRAWGWAVLLVEYPGYGRSSGKPSERAIHEATRAAHAWATADPRVDPSRIVAWGRSLGGGAAARLAADAGLPALILESSFTGVRPIAAGLGVPGFLVRDPFDNLAALSRYRGRLLVLHGRDDTLIPPSHARALAAAVPGAELHELPCGHNDCVRPWPVVRRFLRQVQS